MDPRRRTAGPGAAGLAGLCLLLAGCGATLPRGWLGVTWGEDAGAAATRLGMACAEWQEWAGAQGYEQCTDLDRPASVYGVDGRLELVRRAGRVVGLAALFRDCAAYDELLDGVVAEFHLERGAGEPYRAASSGEVVRLLRDERDGTCEIVVTDAQFGKAYADHVLQSGLGSLGGSLQPH